MRCMKTIGLLGLSMATLAAAQNAAVSSYLDPDDDFAGDIRIKEVRVPGKGYALNTYWCVLGWRSSVPGADGYGGIQYTSTGNNYIYSIWNDSVTADYLSPKMTFRTFGGEGTGFQSMTYNYPWAPGYWNVLADRAWDVGKKTHTAFFVKDGKTGVWRHLITMVIPIAHVRYGSYSYNFLEDWSGNGLYRQSQIRGGWKRRDSGKAWFPIAKERYSVNKADLSNRSINKSTNWAGGTDSDSTGSFYFMEAGGSIPGSDNAGTTLTIARTAKAPQEEYGTAKVSGLSAAISSDKSKLIVSWTHDSLTVPPFASKLTLNDGDSVVATFADTTPQRRSDTLDISKLDIAAKRYSVTLTVTDMFDGKAAPVSAQFGGPGAGISRRNSDSRLDISGGRLYIRAGAGTGVRILTVSGGDTRAWTLSGKQAHVVDLGGLKLKPGLYVASVTFSDGADAIKFVVP